MNILSSIVTHIKYWNSPVDPEFVARLEKASKEAGQAMGETNPLPYLLQINRKNVAIQSGEQQSISDRARLLLNLINGRPVKATLYQPFAIGLIGPFAKIRKRARRDDQEVIENALIFWPAPGGNLSPEKTRHVLKVAVGRNDHANEIKMLSEVRAATGAAPRIEASDPRQQWLVIEYIASARDLSAAEQARIYLDRICEPYFRHFGVEERPAADLLESNMGEPIHHSIDDLNAAADALGITNFSALIEGSLTWSQTHGGGICEEILLSKDNKPYLLDWEKTAFTPIGDDLLQVFQYEPNLTLTHFEKMRTENSLAAKDQLAVSLIFRHATRRSKKKPTQKLIAADHQCADLLKALA